MSFDPVSLGIKPFDFSKKFKMYDRFPYHLLISIVSIMWDDYKIDEDCYHVKKDGSRINILNYINYFKIVDNYFRYGIPFEDIKIHYGNRLYLKRCTYTEEGKNTYRFCVRYKNFHLRPEIINNKQYFGDTYYLNIDEIDTGVKKISDLEKYKRKKL